MLISAIENMKNTKNTYHFIVCSQKTKKSLVYYLRIQINTFWLFVHYHEGCPYSIKSCPYSIKGCAYSIKGCLDLFGYCVGLIISFHAEWDRGR